MPRAALAVVLLACGTPALPQVLRCESPEGKVTYANGGCPPGTSLKREVPPAPPVSDADRKRAAAQAKADAAQMKKVEQAERTEAEKRQREQAAAAKKAQERERECAKLAQQLQRAEDQLAAATLAKRETAARTRDRAREQYEGRCR